MFPFRRRKEITVVAAMRLAVGTLFLWFGLDKWLHPDVWVGFVPHWLEWATVMFGTTALMALVGAFEVALGSCLALGRWPRLSLLLADAYLLVGAVMGGVNDSSIRDVALAGVCWALFVQENQRAEDKFVLPNVYLIWLWRGYVVILLTVGLLYLGAI